MTTRPAHHAPGSPVRSRSARFVAGAMAVGVTAGLLVASGGPADAASGQLANSSGRFLSGTVGSTSLDTVAGIEGESASYPSNPGANENSLNAELLNKAITLPLGSSGLQIPDLTGGAIQLGAVAQYAKANADGSALGASGAVDSNGGIGVGGSNGVPTGGATLDLSGSKALSAVTSQIANLKLTIGAVSARAQQVAIGKSIADPSASCTSGTYSRVSDTDQAGKYNIAGLSIDLTSPLLATVGSTLVSSLGTVLTTANVTSVLNMILGSTGGLISVTGIPNATTLLDGLLKLSLANGSITVDLTSGALHIDLAGLLKFLGLDLNNLCPNTSLLPYVVKALTSELPKAVQSLIDSVDTKITDSLGGITITVAGVAISVGTLTSLVSSLSTTLTGAISTLLNAVDTSALNPLLQILSDNLLNLVANGQGETGRVLTETSLQLNLLPGGGTATLPTLPPLPTVPGLNQSAIRSAQTAQARSNAQYKAAHPDAKSTTYTLPAGTAKVTALKAAQVAAVSPAAATTATVQVNLAQATVGPNAAAPVTTPTPTPTTSVPTTAVPTGVPAGQAGTGGSPELPLVLVLITLVLAGGGVATYRFRGNRPQQH